MAMIPGLTASPAPAAGGVPASAAPASPGQPIPGLGNSTASEEQQFSFAVAQQTGLDPRVVTAWAQQETGGSANAHNWLNLRPFQGDPYASVSSGGFEQFSTLGDAVTATVKRIRQPFAAPIIASEHKSPAQEISAIASTGWDSGHYGGPGGPNLLRTFLSLYPGQGGSPAITAAGSGAPGTGALAGIANNPVGAVTSVTSSVTDAAKFVFSYRFLEILGGGALILVGLYILAQQFKSTALASAIPLPAGAKQAAASTGLTPEVRETRAAAKESRAGELHQVRVKTEKARATELRT